MRNHSRGLIALFLVVPILTNAQFENKTISKSLAFIKSHESFLCHAGQKYGIDPHEPVSIGFPFLIEFFQQEEVSAHNGIESIYIHLGGRETNLRAGEFRLQSTMVENIERIIGNHPNHFQDFLPLIQYEQNDERSVRAERLERMKNVEWQFTYLFAFTAIANSCFFAQDYKDISQKMAFYSVAFHLGFETQISEIKDCYEAYQEGQNGGRIDACRQRANLTAEFMSDYAPVLSCTEEVAKW